MSFILNLFSSHDDPSTPSSPTSPDTPVSPTTTPTTTTTDKQNAAALKSLIKLHKQALRAEYSRFVLDYKLALDLATQEHKRARKHAEEVLQRRAGEAVRRRMEVIAGSEEVLRADEKTRKVFLEFRRSLLGDAPATVGAVGGSAAIEVEPIGGGTIEGGGEVGREGVMMMQGFEPVEIQGFLVPDTYSSFPFSAQDNDGQEIQFSNMNGKVTFMV
ncbi:MAG: hypothetical protein J3R72DRAFT_437665 [Linnemannia gamsii]|nr:MAG: hypothetical protein J3R72DRAFT_437665 [Linnemannia gamsii]